MSIGRYTRDAEHFVVVTPFEYGGRDFVEGETFPWRDLGLVEYQRRTLWIANKIGVVDAPAPDSLGGFEVLARIGAAFAVPPPPVPPPAKAKLKRSSAEA